MVSVLGSVLLCLAMALVSGDVETRACGKLDKLLVRNQWTYVIKAGENRFDFNLALWDRLKEYLPEVKAMTFGKVKGTEVLPEKLREHVARVVGSFDSSLDLIYTEGELESHLGHLHNRNEEMGLDSRVYKIVAEELLKEVASRIPESCLAIKAWEGCVEVIKSRVIPTQAEGGEEEGGEKVPHHPKFPPVKGDDVTDSQVTGDDVTESLSDHFTRQDDVTESPEVLADPEVLPEVGEPVNLPVEGDEPAPENLPVEVPEPEGDETPVQLPEPQPETLPEPAENSIETLPVEGTPEVLPEPAGEEPPKPETLPEVGDQPETADEPEAELAPAMAEKSLLWRMFN